MPHVPPAMPASAPHSTPDDAERFEVWDALTCETQAAFAASTASANWLGSRLGPEFVVVPAPDDPTEPT